jgi:3-phenylpropionate/trans-cinnamate dioxygenase ferredoxin reductase component
MTSMDRIVVAGAGAAGVTAAETLRREGFAGHLVLLGEKHDLAYDRPPLSKQVLSGSWNGDRVTLRSATHYQDLEAAGIDVHHAAKVRPDRHRDHRTRLIVGRDRDAGRRCVSLLGR